MKTRSRVAVLLHLATPYSTDERRLEVWEGFYLPAHQEWAEKEAAIDHGPNRAAECEFMVIPVQVFIAGIIHNGLGTYVARTEKDATSKHVDSERVLFEQVIVRAENTGHVGTDEMMNGAGIRNDCGNASP